MAPFDLVFEYNHAVEGWQAFSRPTISRLGEMVHIIGDFMREMSQLVQKEYARYGASTLTLRRARGRPCSMGDPWVACLLHLRAFRLNLRRSTPAHEVSSNSGQGGVRR